MVIDIIAKSISDWVDDWNGEEYSYREIAKTLIRELHDAGYIIVDANIFEQDEDLSD